MRIKKYDYLINENGDIWMVQSVHKNGDVTIVFNGSGGGEDDELIYDAGQIGAWFRKLPNDDYDTDWLDPKPYWSSKTAVYKTSGKAKKKSKKSSNPGLGAIR